jgi:hypothetical protein
MREVLELLGEATAGRVSEHLLDKSVSFLATTTVTICNGDDLRPAGSKTTTTICNSERTL